MAEENSEDKVFVALPDSYDDGKLVLLWVLSHFSEDNTKIIITHVITSPIKGTVDPTPWPPEILKIDLVLDKYMRLCEAQKFRAEILVHVSDDIAEGLVQLVALYKIKNLVMRTAPDNKMTRLVYETANRVRSEANPSCKIWFVHDENLIFTREANSDVISRQPSLDVQNFQPSSSSSSSSSSSTFRRLNTNTSFQERDTIIDTLLKEMRKGTSLEARDLLKIFTKVADQLKEKQEKHILMQSIEELMQEKYRMRGEIEVANKKIVSLEIQVSYLEHCIKDQKITSSLFEDRLDLVQSEYNKLLLEKARREKEFHFGLSNYEFPLQELNRATKDFDASLKIGDGGSGPVYKGSLRKTLVAIKMLRSQNRQDPSQFEKMVAILTKLRHPNLVSLMGVCSEAPALVYEYLLNGSLENRLKCANNTPPLTWQVRTRIIGDICSALVFLHLNKPQILVHEDLKPENILLDANFVGKLKDVGISHLLKQPNDHTNNLVGLSAYTDPEILTTGTITQKCDMYAFGIITLQLLTGRPPIDIARVVRDAMRNGIFKNIIDKTAGEWPFAQARKFAKLGLRCADLHRNKRPDTMTNVWEVVEPLMATARKYIPLSSRLDSADENPPSHFICPIYQDIMTDPQVAADGFTYEAEAIKLWFIERKTSPMTNLALPNQNLIPNLVLRSAIQDWLGKHPLR